MLIVQKNVYRLSVEQTSMNREKPLEMLRFQVHWRWWMHFLGAHLDVNLSSRQAMTKPIIVHNRYLQVRRDKSSFLHMTFFFHFSSYPPARTSGWTVSVLFAFVFFPFSRIFWCRSAEVDCMNIKQSTLRFAPELFYLIYDWQFDGTRVEEVCVRPLTFFFLRTIFFLM